MQRLRTVTKKDVAGKRVLVRVDFNVPLEKSGGVVQVRDDRRLRAALPTIKLLQEAGAKIILISHLGRPKGAIVPELSLEPIAQYLKKKLNLPVTFSTNYDEPKLDTIVLLENLRFYEGETTNDAGFAKKLAGLADVYVNEAFSNSHRNHASMVGVTKYLPSFAGVALTEESNMLASLTTEPKRPFVVVLGGAKISDKVGALTNLANIADLVLIGGAIANNFLSAEGFEIYRSFVEEASKKDAGDYVAVARRLIDEHKTEKVLKDNYIPLPKLLYPIDVVAAPNLDTTDADELKTIDLSHDMADKPEKTKLQYLDIGPKTKHLYSELLAGAGTIFWNGPMGVWENPLFSAGTQAIARAITTSRATTVLGGGDTIAAAHHFHAEHKFSYISAAGGAALKFLGGEVLPGLKPLIIPS
ncbi:MAG: phosphoglycerate kinase [Candidatus Pacebacteria bacterium]|nr:phosphoglycerate kinase [Candidatus Paceibacterota bacterium]PIR59908.1 MAG: phosphoglycerate kinase [Candidatus Pacebacteria bacterium CG10_big_fil_rev_8_21_14_0_10_45_6]